MAQKRGAKRSPKRKAKRAGPGKLLGTLAAITMVAVVGVVGTRAAISATTDNTGNEFNAGEITLSDNDAGSFMYKVDNALPGDTISKCIEVSYTSTPNLNSNVKLFISSGPIGTVGPYVDMTVDAGTQSGTTFPDCTGFTPTANLYTGTLSAFQAAYNSDATGLAYSPHGATPWVNNDSVVYRVTLTMSSRTRATGENFSGPHTYTWQATTA